MAQRRIRAIRNPIGSQGATTCRNVLIQDINVCVLTRRVGAVTVLRISLVEGDVARHPRSVRDGNITVLLPLRYGAVPSFCWVNHRPVPEIQKYRTLRSYLPD